MVEGKVSGSVKEETEPLVLSTTIHPAHCSPSVSITNLITWNIENVLLSTDHAVIHSEKFPSNKKGDRFYVETVKHYVGSIPTLTFSVYKCGEVDKKLVGGLMSKHRPVVTVYDGDEEVEVEFDDESEAVVEMSDEWRGRFVKEGVLRVGCSVVTACSKVDLNLGSLWEIIAGREVGRNLWHLRKSGDYSDVTVYCKYEDHGGFFAHKYILAARSTYLKQLLDQAPGNIRMQYEEDTTRALLEYIYSGRCDSKNLTLEMLAAADEYKLRGLKLKVENHLADSLKHDNVLTCLVQAISHNACHLHQACVRYIISNELSQTITQSQEWKAMDDLLKIDLATRFSHI